MTIYMIGDLARLTGLSKHTLNYYLNIGLISQLGQSERSRYRYFDDSTIKRLERIIELRKQDNTIKQIENMLGEG